jgi:lipid-binding SYLF domain-containing protein
MFVKYNKVLIAVALIAAVSFLRGISAHAAEGIDAEVDMTLETFKETKGASSLVDEAAGLLVYPAIVKAGLVFGGEYGEGALLVDGETKGYYNMAAGSVGFQLGIQKKSVIIAFMDQNALESFQRSSGWKIGADASVAVIAIGAGGMIDTKNIDDPVVAFVFDQKGLMYNVTLEGAKITEIEK